MSAEKANPGVRQLMLSLTVAEKETGLLTQTRGRLFRTGEQVDSGWVRRVAEDADLSERLEAFSARFGRLQDTVMDKVLPRLLLAAGENAGSAIDNLNHADRLGLVDRPDDWIVMRQLRNRLVHEYMEDAVDFASVLNDALRLASDLVETVDRIRRFATERFASGMEE